MLYTYVPIKQALLYIAIVTYSFTRLQLAFVLRLASLSIW